MTTIKMHNPYSGKSWEVAEPDPSLGLPSYAVVLIMNGEQRIVHKRAIASLKNEGMGWYDKEYFKD